MFSNNSNPKIVVIGSCAVDFTTYAPRLPNPGETLQGTKFTTSFGGKGANQCVAAAKLGGNTAMICCVGDDQWGQKYRDNLNDAGVDVSHVYTISNTTTGIAQITVAESGENQIVIVLGANGYLNKADVERARELITSADVLIGQLETPFETTLEAFKINRGIKLFNAAPGKSNIQKILPYCSILCVNESEASILTNHNVNSVTTAAEASKKILNTGCETVIITLGEVGAVYASKGESTTYYVICDQVVSIDTTGAGDAFVGALATFLVSHKDKPLHQIIGAACEVASISVTKEGTQTSYPTSFTYTPFNREYKYEKLQ